MSEARNREEEGDMQEESLEGLSGTAVGLASLPRV
jgi:hypothetical protein